MNFNREDIVAAFLAESQEGLDIVEQSLIAAEADPSNLEVRNDIFRVAHTIKGNAAALGFSELAGFAHVVEDLLDLIRRQGALPQQAVTLILQAVDAFRVLVPAACADNDVLESSHRQLKRNIAQFVATFTEERSDNSIAHPTTPTKPNGHDEARNRTLRVDVAKLDLLLNLAGEIAIAQGRLHRMIEELGDAGRNLLEKHREIERLFKDVQEQVMSVRMVPVGPMFQQFVRAVRDISHSHDKLARLETIGDDVEVDTRILEHLKDPLLHMIRNAVDHGLETPAEREQCGKPACGVLRLKASHGSGHIVIQLSDDGRGFDRKRIVARAKSLGLLNDNEQLSDQDIFRLVFHAGFSTADEITDLSGRGVGMDVVRSNIEALRGNIEIESAAGSGTTITLRLPLTLAIIEGFLVAADGETYVIPLEAIRECVELPAAQTDSVTSGMISLRGEPLPYLRLREILGANHGPVPIRESVVVVRHQGRCAGLAVDKLLGESQTIIKPLCRLFRRVDGVSGSTILGDGRVALILDIESLLRKAIDVELQKVS